MKTQTTLNSLLAVRRLAAVSRFPFLILFASLVAVSCRPRAGDSNASAKPGAPDPLAVVLSPHAGDARLDREIRRLQDHLRGSEPREPLLEQLGWAFVAKARESFDAGFYKLAEQCALGIEQRRPQSPEAWLLRGHVLHSLHCFKEAETLARQLVEVRGLSFDHALLGDVLMEQGKLNAAVEAYQRMVNLKPDLHAYARVAHMRWLKGDLAGATEAMQLAADAASPLGAESAAWVNTRLAGYEFQAAHFEEAGRRCEFALSFQTNYAPALLLRGRIKLAQNQPADAVADLQRAAKLNPLPEYQWALAESLRAAGHGAEALSVEEQLRRHGAMEDPRTFALFLATRRETPDIALQLARAEFESRDDVFTRDAFAWSLAAAGRFAEAQGEIERALAEGTEDGRLFFHAAVIAARSGRDADARRWFAKASALQHLLLPSERNQFQNLAAQTTGPAETPGPDTAQHLSAPQN